MEIIKHYKITKWCQYEEVTDVPVMSLAPSFTCHTMMSGHPVYVEQWINDDTGEGYEVRKFTVEA